MRSLVIAILVSLAGFAGACDKDSQPLEEERAKVLSEAQEMFSTKCARCHGASGAANGFLVGTMRPRPHNYTDPAWQASVTDDQIKEVILRGGRSLHKNVAMPGYPMLKNRPELLNALVKVIRDFGKHP